MFGRTEVINPEDKRLPKTEKDWKAFERALTSYFGDASYYTIDRPLKRTGKPGVKVGWWTDGTLCLMGAGLTWKGALRSLEMRKKSWLPKWKLIRAKQEPLEAKERREKRAAQRAARKILKASKKVWISAYAMTSGIFCGQATITRDGKSAVLLDRSWQPRHRENYGPGNWHWTRAKAIEAAKRLKRARICELETRLWHLRKQEVQFEKPKEFEG